MLLTPRLAINQFNFISSFQFNFISSFQFNFISDHTLPSLLFDFNFVGRRPFIIINLKITKKFWYRPMYRYRPIFLGRYIGIGYRWKLHIGAPLHTIYQSFMHSLFINPTLYRSMLPSSTYYESMWNFTLLINNKLLQLYSKHNSV